MINFHQRIIQFHGEMKEKDEDQDSICTTSIFIKNFKDLQRYVAMVYNIASRRRKGSRTDQKQRQDLLVRVFRRRGAIFRPSMAEHDVFAQRRRSFAQRADRSARRPSLSEAALICHARQIQRSRCFLTNI